MATFRTLLQRLWRPIIYSIGVLIICFLIFGILWAPLGPGLETPMENSDMQRARIIGLAMFSYSVDHDGKYPDGKSSTEVFQKLIDGKYITDPAIFYIPYPGKTKAQEGERLKPENVCWDVTCCLDTSAPDELPAVFITGYKINYIPGGTAVPLIKPYPKFGPDPRNWTQWSNGEPRRPVSERSPGIAVCYKSNSAQFRKLPLSENPNGAIPNFIDLNFNPAGRTYRQLTPDGPLP